MSGSGGRAGALLLLAVAAGAVAVVSRDDSDAARLVVPAVEAEQAAEVSSQAGVPLPDFWARAKAMGVSAAILRPQSLEDAIRRGEILRFDRAEVERWKAAGLLSPSTTLKPDTYWTKDARLFEQLLQALARAGVTPSTSTLAGFRVLQIPEGRGLLELQGYDPERVASASALAELYAPPAGPPKSPGLEPAWWRVGMTRAALMRRALGRPRRLLVLRLEPALGLERNFEELRGALRELSARGAPLGAPAAAPLPKADGPARAGALAGAWLIGLLGPLFAARGGLLVLRRLRAWATASWPVGSPVVQLAGGLVATAALAAAGGVVVHALGALTGAPLPRRWAAGTLVGPLVVAVLTLYTIDLEEWGRTLAKPATYAGLLRLAALAATLVALLAPRWTLQRLGLWGPLEAVGARVPAAWWWPWRWRETLLGAPAMVQALFLINWRLECPDCSSLPAAAVNDPRHWFLLGLLLPVGVTTAVGQGAAPELMALAHTPWTLLFGALLGGFGIVLRLRSAHAHHGVPAPAKPAEPAAAARP